MKLAIRFLLPTLAGLFIAFTVYALMAFRREVHMLQSDSVRDHEVMARALGPAFSQAWVHGGAQEAQDVLSNVNAKEGTLRSRWIPTPNLAESPGGLEGTWHNGFFVVKHEEGPEPEQLMFAPIEVGEQRGFIEIRESTRERRQYIRDSLLRAVFAGLGVFGLTCMMVVALGFLFIARPLRQLVKHAQKIGLGELGEETQIEQRDEIGVLATEMNRMSRLLAQSRARLERETSERLEALQKLRHADRLATVGKLASGIAHELGTPLNVVRGRARLIMDVEPSETTTRNAQIIVQQAERMTGIIRQLLDFARAGTTDKRRTDLPLLIRRIISMLSPVASERGVKLGVSEESATDIETLAQSSQLDQVLTNVIVNAIQATERGGSVSVKLSLEASQDGTPGAWAAISIADTGKGMTPEVAARVFEPFFTTKEVGEGTGLGLSVAYGIVVEHGGQFRVESKAGEGSVFSILLPLHRSSSELTQRPTSGTSAIRLNENANPKPEHPAT